MASLRHHRHSPLSPVVPITKEKHRQHFRTPSTAAKSPGYARQPSRSAGPGAITSPTIAGDMTHFTKHVMKVTPFGTPNCLPPRPILPICRLEWQYEVRLELHIVTDSIIIAIISIITTIITNTTVVTVAAIIPTAASDTVTTIITILISLLLIMITSSGTRIRPMWLLN